MIAFIGLAKKFLKEQLVFIAVSFVPFFLSLDDVNAQSLPAGVSFFSSPHNIGRGTLGPVSTDGELWEKSYWCPIVKKQWGWESCEGINTFIVGYNQDIDTLIAETPNSDGYVKFDDWNSSSRADEIAQIEHEIEKSLKAQSKKLGIPIKFEGWRVYPKLDQERHVLYYATDIRFGNEITTNIKASVFDRKGYIKFVFVPTSTTLGSEQIEKLVLTIVEHYRPSPAQGYKSFVSTDKVAAVGAIGVLATLVGVKYGKAATAGFVAFLLILLKKAWFVIFLPFIILFNFLKNKLLKRR